MKSKATCGRETPRRLRRREDGFSMVQVLIVLAVAGVLATVATVSIQGARQSLRLSNSARVLAGYLEKARTDSIRRRAQAGSESSVQIIDTTSYRVTMGFGGSDVLSSRDFTLDSGVTFTTIPTTISFDWRGRPLTGTEVTLALENSSGTTQVDVTGSGDVTVGSEIFQDASIPTVTLNTNVPGDKDVALDPAAPVDSSPTATPDPSPTPTSTASPTATPYPTPTPSATPTPTPNGSPTPSPTATPTPTPPATPTPTPVPCLPSLNTSSITVRKNGGTKAVTLTLSGGGSGTVSTTGPGNLTITPASQVITPGGAAVFTITSNNNTRGSFTVTFSTGCGSTNLTVTVANSDD